MFSAKRHVPTQAVSQWGRVQIADGGDTICCRRLVKPGALGRDSTYIRVGLLSFASFQL